MKKRFLRVSSIFLVLSMLINMLPMNVLATETQAEDHVILTEDQNIQANDFATNMHNEESLAEDAYVLNEVIEERTEYSKTFRLSNGLNMAAVYSNPVHYASDGQWKNIDNTLQLSTGPSSNTYTNTAGRWLVSFPQRLTENNGVTISMEDYFLSFRMTGELRNTGDVVMDSPTTEDRNTAADGPADIGDIKEENSESLGEDIGLGTETLESTEEITGSMPPEEGLLMDATTEETPSADADAAKRVSAQEDEEGSSSAGASESATQEPVVDQMTAIVLDSLVEPMSESDIFVEPTKSNDMREMFKHEEMIADKLASSLKYEDVYANTDLVYNLISNQVKEYIIINQYCADLKGYQYILEMDSLRPVLTDENVIELYDVASNELVMLMPAPYLVDTTDQYCFDVGVLLQEENGSYVLSYVLPQEWLADESRVWPVTLDPAVQSVADATKTVDQTLYQYASSSASANTMNCGYESGCGIMRMFLKYTELPKLGLADVIMDASISLYAYEKNGSGSALVEVHEITNSWDANEITWSNPPAYDDMIADFTTCSGAGWLTWDITEIVRGWYEDSGTNYGLAFKVSNSIENAAKNNWMRFYTANFSVACQPTLTITFRNNNGLEDYWDYTTSSAGRAGTGYINNYTGNLVFVRDDIGFGGNRMPVNITHIYNSNDSQKNEFGMGYGWRTNFNQRVYIWDHEDADGKYYVWEDADGTAHYFLYNSANTYLHEDGLQLTLKTGGSGNQTYTITDLYGNVSYFDGMGRLAKIENNQATKSSISITYTTDTGYYIKSITDGVNRKYDFTYYASNNLSRISYKGTGTSELAYLQYSYSNNLLTTVTYQDGGKVHYSYIAKNLLLYAQDVDGYKLTYTYSNASSTLTNIPSRIKSVTETDGTATGGKLTFVYGQNQTTITDISGNVQIYQFNNWGNTVSIQNDQGRAQYAQYAINDPAETAPDSSAKGNQLRLSSKLQNTVGNVLDNSSFESSSGWTATTSTVTCSSWGHTNTYAGSKFLRVQNTGTGNQGAASPSFSVKAGETYTFSAYVYSDSATAYLDLYGSSSVASSEKLAGGGAWTRLEVSYTATADITLKARIMIVGSGTIFADCVQVEKAPTASRYNLAQNGDFRHTTFWSASSGRTTPPTAAPAIELNATAYKLTGSPTATNRLSQTVAVSGSAGDNFVLAGWATGNSVPIDDGSSRRFGLILTFNNTDGTTTTAEAKFNPYVTNWQYAAIGASAAKDYSSVKIELAYDYNANTAFFDGIQLFREKFGSTYTYYNNGCIKAATDIEGKTTTYGYNSTNDITSITLPSGEKVTYTYDSYHNVKSATTAEGIVYTLTYDTWGNNTQLSIGSGSTKITSKAAYTSDGNYLASTTDASGNTTTYSYDTTTGNLNSVQHPNDSTSTKTQYAYDENTFRLKSASVTTDSGQTLTASYTYTLDQLTKIQTKSTAYTFNYGSFGLRSSVLAGSRTLASYTYTSGTNYLSKLDYGNGDKVQYTYNTQGQLTAQTYETGDTVKYGYNNDGVLAEVDDKGTGIKTKYYYDLTNRLVKYTEEGSNTRSVCYTYDDENNLSQLTETVFGRVWTSHYAYDTDNRMTSSRVGTSKRNYTYDSFGRLSTRQTVLDTTVILTDTYQYNGNTSQVKSIQKSGPKGDGSFSYTYDKNGNIQSVTSVNSSGTNAVTYTYDSANQLTRENNQKTGKTTVWTYDNAGNIKTRKEYAYTTGTLGTATSTVNYAYADSKGWGDLLTSYNGQSISYDEIGNPTSYYNGTRWTMTWERGRQLATMSDGTTTWTNTYNADGLRTQRTDGTTTYTYTYDNAGRLTGAQRNDLQMWIFYDENGPTTLKYGSGTFHYVLNLQGDVVALIGGDGRTLVEYTYDAWGNVIDIDGEYAYNLGEHNPIRYRGYIYDTETGLYYVSSRYYDPEIGRFINADILVSTGQGVLGNNMFAYCLNNPINYVDPSGTLAYPGEIHNEVVRRIADKYGFNKEQFILYEGGGFGRADLISSDGQVWDVKRDKPRQIKAGKKQVQKYVENTWARSPDTPLSVGGNEIESGYFYHKSGLTTYKVTYRYAGDGVIAYDYRVSEFDYQTLATTVLVVGVAAAAGIAAGLPSGAIAYLALA